MKISHLIATKLHANVEIWQKLANPTVSYAQNFGELKTVVPNKIRAKPTNCGTKANDANNRLWLYIL